MITLHPYQDDLVSKIREAFKKFLAVLMVLPTGGGKTVIFCYMASKIAAAGQRIIILVHRDELLQQVSETLTEFNVAHGMIAAGRPYDRRYMVHVASAQTLVNRLDRVAVPDYCIPDEAHHCITGSTWDKIFSHWRAVKPKLRILGVTATPRRLSGEGLGVNSGGPFETMVVGPSPRWLIDNGFLSKYRIYVPPIMFDRSELRKNAGEYVRGSSEHIVTKPKVVGSVIDQYKQKLDGAPSALFAPSIKSCEIYAERFRAAGYVSVSVDGRMDKSIRRSIISDFKRGAINVLSSCALLNEGFDCKGIIGGIDVSPTESLALSRQRDGRTLRKMAGVDIKTLIDHVGNHGSIENGVFVPKHGMPDDDIEWSLDGAQKRERTDDAIASPRQCSHCFAMSRATATVCQECGQPFAGKPREVKEVEGELIEIDPSIAKREARREQGMTGSLDDLVKLGIKRYGAIKGPRWARYVYAGRQAKQRRNEPEITPSQEMF